MGGNAELTCQLGRNTHQTCPVVSKARREMGKIHVLASGQRLDGTKRIVGSWAYAD